MRKFGVMLRLQHDVVDPQGVLPSVLYSQEGGMFSEDGKPNDWAGEQGRRACIQIDLIDKYHVMPASVTR